MTLLRWNPKRDACEKALVRELNQRGFTTFPVSGRGFPDLFCVKRGVACVIEIKGKGKKLTPAQQDTFAIFRAIRAPAFIVRTSECIDEVERQLFNGKT